MRRSRLADFVGDAVRWGVVSFLAAFIVGAVYLLSMWVWWQVTGWW